MAVLLLILKSANFGSIILVDFFVFVGERSDAGRRRFDGAGAAHALPQHVLPHAHPRLRRYDQKVIVNVLSHFPKLSMFVCFGVGGKHYRMDC